MTGTNFPIALMQGSGSQGLISFLPLILIFGIFYFLVIAPARKRQKNLQATIDGLKKGDGIVTTGGLYGEVVSVDTSTLVVKISDNVRVKIAKSAVSGLAKDSQTETRK